MIKKKVCMLGSFAVGKTSLVQRFVTSIFSDKYLTTVGVKVDKITVSIDNQEINLLLWDIYGEDEFQKVKTSYLRGASGYFLVIDGTRKTTLDTALMLNERAEETIGRVPFVCLLNKVDLTDEWEFSDTELDTLSKKGWFVMNTSAKTGQGVEAAFLSLTKKMLEK